MLSDKRELVKIAYYYYKDGLTQQEIADKLSISRQKVNRSMKRIHEEGIVKIEIIGLEDSYEALESELERKFNLKRAVIVHSDNEEDLIQQLGNAGASYVLDNLVDDINIGVSWGKTLHAVGSQLENVQKSNIHVVQMVGGVNSTTVADVTNEIARLFADKIGAIPHYLYAPAIVTSRMLKDSMLAETSIQIVLERLCKCDMAIIGIGELGSDSTIYQQNYMDKEYLAYLHQNQAVGDICLHVFDKEGSFIDDTVKHFSVGVSKEQLMKIPHVVAIAGGKEKSNAIIGALRTGVINVLVTDVRTADLIMKDG